MTFHGLRATGITWLALAGTEPMRIMQRAGHQRFDTTLGYIREAEAVGVDVGTPSPATRAHRRARRRRRRWRLGSVGRTR